MPEVSKGWFIAGFLFLLTFTFVMANNSLEGLCRTEGSILLQYKGEWVCALVPNLVNDPKYNSNVVVNQYFHRHTGLNDYLTNIALSGSININVSNASKYSIGDHIEIINGQIETTYPQITGIVGNTLQLDRPLDQNFNINDTIEGLSIDLADVTGTRNNPYIYKIHPDTNKKFHITRIIISCVNNVAMADSNLCGDTALTNGIVMRVSLNGTKGTFTNWKNNADISNDMYDVTYTDKAGGGNYGLRGMGTFTNIEVLVSLDPTQNDYIELLIQDDLTGIIDLSIKAQGYFEQI